MLAADQRFGPAQRARFAHTVELAADEVAERVASMSQVQSATPADRDGAIAQARSFVLGMPGERGTFRYTTEVEIRRRR